MRQGSALRRDDSGRTVRTKTAIAATAGLLALLALLGCDHGVRLLGPYDAGESPRPDGADADAPDTDVGDADARRDDVRDPDGDPDYEPPFDGRFERPDGYCPLPGFPRYTYAENGAYALPTAAGPAPVSRRRPTLSWGTIGGGCDNPIFDLELDDSCRPDAVADCAFPSPELQVYDIAHTRWTSTHDLPVSNRVPVGTRYAWRLRGCCPGNCCTEWNRPRYIEVGRQPNDLDGDGYGDLLVGAPRTDAAGTPPGSVYLFLGGPAPDAGADHVLTGANDGDRFGATAAWLRDLDADGFADFGVAVPGTHSVQLFRGAASGSPEPILDYPVRGARYAAGPAAAGDFDGDGFADAAVAARSAAAADGGLIVLRGGTRPGTDVWRFDRTYDHPAELAVAGVGDQLGNGYATIALGLSDVWEPECPRGSVALFDGAAASSDVGSSGFEISADWLECHDRFGQTLDAVGDVNEDGFDDILVGDGDYPAYGLTARALVYFGPLPPGWPGISEPAAVGRAAEYDTGFAEALAGAGDVNRDGHVDLAVGAPREGGFGRVHLYLGTGTLESYVELVLDAPVGAPAGFGAAVAGAPDVNGDGFDDLLVGAPGAGAEVGAAYLYLGGDPPSTAPALELRGRDPGDRFGASVD
ncbi:MAG: FG-GAP repeat protein [Deltaproteobacteria bacterium]|nr:FG-GAP repeat protein [Deltaproteobacteria bacterium]